MESDSIDLAKLIAEVEAENEGIFYAPVVVAGVTRMAEIKDDRGILYLNTGVVSYRHRTGTKTYAIHRPQLARRRDGKYAPVITPILRRPAMPVSWDETPVQTNRDYY